MQGICRLYARYMQGICRAYAIIKYNDPYIWCIVLALGVWAYTYTCTYTVYTCILEAYTVYCTGHMLSKQCNEESRLDGSPIINYYEQNIYLQRRSSQSFFERYTRLYHEPWYSVFNQIVHQMAGSTADLYWKEVAAHKLPGKTHPKVVCIYCQKT